MIAMTDEVILARLWSDRMDMAKWMSIARGSAPEVVISVAATQVGIDEIDDMIQTWVAASPAALAIKIKLMNAWASEGYFSGVHQLAKIIARESRKCVPKEIIAA